MLFWRSYFSIKTLFEKENGDGRGSGDRECSWSWGSCLKGQWLDPGLPGAGTRYPPGPTHWERWECDDTLPNLPPRWCGRPHSPDSPERSPSSMPPCFRTGRLARAKQGDQRMAATRPDATTAHSFGNALGQDVPGTCHVPGRVCEQAHVPELPRGLGAAGRGLGKGRLTPASSARDRAGRPPARLCAFRRLLSLSNRLPTRPGRPRWRPAAGHLACPRAAGPSAKGPAARPPTSPAAGQRP